MVGSVSLKLETQKQQAMVLKFLDVILHELQLKTVSLTLDIKIAKTQALSNDSSCKEHIWLRLMNPWRLNCPVIVGRVVMYNARALLRLWFDSNFPQQVLWMVLFLKGFMWLCRHDEETMKSHASWSSKHPRSWRTMQSSPRSALDLVHVWHRCQHGGL